MSQIMKVPKGKQPEHGVVICRGSEYNLWKSKREFNSPFTILSRRDAQIEGLKMEPGTLLISGTSYYDVDNFNREMKEINLDLKKEIITVNNNKLSLYKFLSESTKGYRPSYPYYTKPFDIRDW